MGPFQTINANNYTEKPQVPWLPLQFEGAADETLSLFVNTLELRETLCLCANPEGERNTKPSKLAQNVNASAIRWGPEKVG